MGAARFVLTPPCFPWVVDFFCDVAAFVSFLQDSAAFSSSAMPLGFMARSGLIDSLMFAEVCSTPAQCICRPLTPLSRAPPSLPALALFASHVA